MVEHVGMIWYEIKIKSNNMWLYPIWRELWTHDKKKSVSVNNQQLKQDNQIAVFIQQFEITNWHDLSQYWMTFPFISSSHTQWTNYKQY